MDFYQVPSFLAEHLNVPWTLMLLMTRYTAFFMTVPGLGGGERGLLVRVPAMFVLSFATLSGGLYADLPQDWVQIIM
jgi:flagellar biosynthesis protein FliR